ncbi:MAG: family 10 glycosylhydrolase [Clostridia bacterium]|nr:family 10 glycosylhydrolase [Clostridia bacterium]
MILFLSACQPISFGEIDSEPSFSEPPRKAWQEAVTYEAKNYEIVRGLWISQFDLFPICVDGEKQRKEADYTRRAQQMIDNAASLGINTVFVQVRPNGDSFYPSELFPSSRYATGRIGSSFEYDPFSILLELAHKAELSVHAWINPLRCFSEGDRATLNEAKSSEAYRALLWSNRSLYDDYIQPVNGIWYLNPAYKETRGLVCEGVAEILSRYNVDGIHIDDYFYPTTEQSFDAVAFAAYRSRDGTDSLGAFRREAINCLVKELWETVRAAGGNRLFGVSPGGNLERNYNELYADVAAWCAKDGYVDYLCPQIYFGWEHDTIPFAKACERFSALTANTSIRLIIGMTLGKAYDGYYGKEDSYAGSGKTEWIEHTDVLRRCFFYAEELTNGNGVAYFSYQYFFSPTDGTEIKETASERSGFVPLLKEDSKKYF